MTKAKTVNKIVDWVLVKKEQIKFQDDDEVYDIADNVMAKVDFDKYPILSNDNVSIIIENEEIVFLRKNKKDDSKSSGNKSSGETEEKELTVEAVYDNKSVKFKEEKINGKKWTPVSKKLEGTDLEKIGIVANKKIVIVLEDNTIVSVKSSVDTEPEQKTNTEKKSYSKSSYRDEDKTDNRTAVMCAKDVVVALIKKEGIKVDVIKKAIHDLTGEFLEAIRQK